MTRKTTPYARKRTQGRARRAKDGITTSRMYTTRLRPAEVAAIGTRFGLTPDQWHPGPCHGHELTALADLVAAHSRQVHELTYAEYTAAFDRAVARVASTGGQVFHMEEVETQ